MAARVLDYYEIKPAFMPKGMRSFGVFVRPGELDRVPNPDEWDFVGRTVHPNALQAADVERKGYCLRALPSWVEPGKWYRKENVKTPAITL